MRFVDSDQVFVPVNNFKHGGQPSNCFKCPIEVINQILCTLYTYRKSDKAFGDAGPGFFILWNISMRHGCRMLGQALSTAKAYRQMNQLQTIQKSECLLFTSMDFKTDHGTRTQALLSVNAVLIRMILLIQ